MSDVDRMREGVFGVRRPENTMGLAEALQRQGAFTQASELRARVERLSATVDDVVAQRDDLAKRLDATQNLLEQAHARIRELRASDLFIQREEWRRLHGEAVADLEAARARIAELKGQNKDLGSDLIDAKLHVEELERRDVVAQLRAELAGALVVADELRIEAGRREREKADLEERLQHEHTRTTRALTLKDELQAKLRGARAVLRLAVDVFDRYRDQGVEWDSGTPDEILIKWEEFAEAIGPYFT